jgi:hypothetical protein
MKYVVQILLNSRQSFTFTEQSKIYKISLLIINWDATSGILAYFSQGGKIRIKLNIEHACTRFLKLAFSAKYDFYILLLLLLLLLLLYLALCMKT